MSLRKRPDWCHILCRRTGDTLDPQQAYRFARGETVTSSTGLRARLLKPLDFMVVADHSENLGLAPMMAESNPELLSSAFGRELQALFDSGELLRAMTFYDGQVADGKDPLPLSEELKTSMWQRMTVAAENGNVPGVFSAMIGYEWTGTPGRQQPASQCDLPRWQCTGK